MAIKTQGKIAAMILVGVCLLALFYPATIPPKGDSPINSGDVAWMLTSTALVLFMTPGLSSLFLRRLGGS